MTLTYAAGSNRSQEGGDEWIVGGTIKLLDDADLRFGTGAAAGTASSGDLSLTWDGTNFVVAALADDQVIEIGDSATTQLSWDVKIYGGAASGASYWYFDASADLLYTTGVDFQLKDNDVLAFGTGAGAAGDVSVVWDATNLIVKATADDTLIEVGDSAATQLSFDVKWYGGTAAGASYLYADASDDVIYTTGVDLWIKDADILSFGNGAGKAGDMGIQYNTTSAAVEFLATADDQKITFGVSAATQKSFDITVYGDAANGADYALFDAGASKLSTAGAYYIGGRTDDAAGRGLVLSVRTTSSAITTSGAVTGAIVFNTVDSKLYVFNGSAWVTTSALT